MKLIIVEKTPASAAPMPDEDERLHPHALDVDAHLLGAVGIVADHLHLRAEPVAVVEERREDDEGDRPEDLHRNAADLAGEDLVGPAVARASTSAIDLPSVMIRIRPRSMKFMPSVAISDDSPA